MAIPVSSFHVHPTEQGNLTIEAKSHTEARWIDLVVTDGYERLPITTFARSDAHLVAMLASIAETALRAIYQVAPANVAADTFERIGDNLDDVVQALPAPEPVEYRVVCSNVMTFGE